MTFKNISDNIEMLRLGSILQEKEKGNTMKWEKIIIIFLIFGYVSLNMRLKSTQYQMHLLMKKGHPIFNDPRWVAVDIGMGKSGPPAHRQHEPTGPIGSPGKRGSPGRRGPPGKRGPLSTKPDDWDDDLDGRWMEMPELVNEVNRLKHSVALLKSTKEDVGGKIKSYEDIIVDPASANLNIIIDSTIIDPASVYKTKAKIDDNENVRIYESIIGDSATSKIPNTECKTDTVINYIDSRLIKLNKAIKNSDFDTRSFLVKELRSLENAVFERLDKIAVEISVPGVDGRDGLPGPMGDMGVMGVKGDDGKDGKDGKPGECPFPVWQITQIVDKRLKEKISFND